MLENGREVPLEIVLPNEDAQEIRVAHGAEHILWQCRGAEHKHDQRCRKLNGAILASESALHGSVAPPARMTAAGLARTAAPRKNPKCDARHGPGRGFCNDF